MSLPKAVQLEKFCFWPVLDGLDPDCTIVTLDVLPRAYVVHRADVLSKDETLDRLASPNWDFRGEILLSETLISEQRDALDAAPTSDDSRVHITEYTPNRVRLNATMEHAGLVVLADPFCRGWRATVDGQDTKVMRANHALRALFLDAGEHDVTFRFCPESMVISALLALKASVLGLVIVVIPDQAWYSMLHSMTKREEQ